MMPTSYSSLRLFGRIASYAFLIGSSLLMVLPFFWMVTTALKGQQEVYLYPPTIFPHEIHWENFSHVLDKKI